MHRCINRGALALVLIWSSYSTSATEPAAVVALSSHDRLAVRGAVQFDPDQVAEALASDLEVLVAAHPSAPLDDYLEVLRRRLLDGYRHAGFLDVSATAEVERITDRIVLTVEEGSRLIAGQVRIEGARLIDTAQLAKQLTQAQRGVGAVAPAFENRDGHNATVWVNAQGEPVDPIESIFKPGKPVPLDELTQDELRKQIRQALEDLGHYRTRFGFNIEPNQMARGAGDLLITIKDEGPAAVLDEIVVEGLRRDSKHVLLDYLGLKPGIPWTLHQRIQAEQRLWTSARYRDFCLRAQPPADASGRFMLRIELAEYAEASPLSQPLSREEKALLAARDSLASLAARGEELVVSHVGQSMVHQVVFSPQHGVLGTYRNRSDGSPLEAFVLSRGNTGLYFPVQNRKFVGSPLAMQINVRLLMQLSGDPARPHRFSFSSSIKQGQSPDAPPCTFTMSLPPSVFVAYLYRPKTKWHWTGTLLTLSSETSTIVIDEASGRLQMIRLGEDGDEITITTGIGAFGGTTQEIVEATRQIPNTFDSSRPLYSIFRHDSLDRLLGQWLEFDAQSMTVARKIMVAALADLLDRWLVGLQKPSAQSEQFILPSDPKPENDGWWEFLTSAAPLAVVHADQIFPRNSWPWVLLRQAAYVTERRDAYLTDDLANLYSRRDAGPICQLLCACLTTNLAPQTSRRFAARGLERLSAAEFQKDMAELLRPDYPLGQAALRMAQTLRDLSDEEAQVFDGTLPRAIVEQLRGAKGPAESLPPMRELRDTVESLLQAFAADKTTQ